jgi:hypothetical protein
VLVQLYSCISAYLSLAIVIQRTTGGLRRILAAGRELIHVKSFLEHVAGKVTKKEGFPYFCQQAVKCYTSKTGTVRNVAQELRHVHMALNSWAVKQVSNICSREDVFQHLVHVSRYWHVSRI